MNLLIILNQKFMLAKNMNTGICILSSETVLIVYISMLFHYGYAIAARSKSALDVSVPTAYSRCEEVISSLNLETAFLMSP